MTTGGGLSHAAVIATWSGLIAGVSCLGLGFVTLARKRVVVGWHRERVDGKAHGFGLILTGLFVVLETVPRLAGASDVLVMALSVGAVVPLAGMAVIYSRGRAIPS